MSKLIASVLFLAAFCVPVCLNAQGNMHYYEIGEMVYHSLEAGLVWDLPQVSLSDDEANFAHIYVQPLTYDYGDGILDQVMDYAFYLRPWLEENDWDEECDCPVCGEIIVTLFITENGRALVGYEEQPDTNIPPHLGFELMQYIMSWELRADHCSVYSFLLTLGQG